MLDVKAIKAGCVLSQGGKPLGGEPVDNVVVQPIAKGPFAQANGQEVVSALQAEHPKCRFLWLSRPVKAPAKGKDKDETET